MIKKGEDMNKRKIVDIIIILIYISSLAFLITFGILWKLSPDFYQMLLYFIMGFGVLGLIGVMTKLFVDKSYDFNIYSLTFMASLTVIAILCHYIVKYFKLYEVAPWLSWVILISLIFISVLVCLILNFKKSKNEKSSNGPKIVSNTR